MLRCRLPNATRQLYIYQSADWVAALRDDSGGSDSAVMQMQELS